MTRLNEASPLLDGDGLASSSRHTRGRSRWHYLLAAGAASGLCAGALSLLGRLDFDDGTISLRVREAALQEDAVAVKPATSVAYDGPDAAFFQSLEASKDVTADPCEDFYQYACGGWLATHEVPANRAGVDASFYVVAEQNKQTIRRVIDASPPQIGELYTSCLNDQEVDGAAVGVVAQLLDDVHAANSTLDLLAYAGELYQSLGVSTFFSASVGADPKDPSINVLQLSQGGLTLPSREYYLEESKVEAYAVLFKQYVTQLFAVDGLSKHNVSAYADAVLQMETKFAEVSLPNAALRDPWTTNTGYSYPEIAQRFPFLMAYLNGINKCEPFSMDLHAIIATPAFFEKQNELLSDDALLPQLKHYVSFHLIDSLSSMLGEYFRRASHEFHGTVTGAGAMLPRDEFCVSLTTSFLGDELGEYYMKDVFGPDAKVAAQALVTEIEMSMRTLLQTEKWLDRVTYDAAVAKLDMVKNYIGGPDDVPPLPFELQSNAFFNNVVSLLRLSAAKTVHIIGKPVDPTAWDMFPSTVNAYYDPSANKMVFPAAILQQPFYSADAFPPAANFARIGMVMGHELSHGFDDQGRNYDGHGALRSWWTASVAADFTEKAQCLADQYSAFPVVSIADGGVLGYVNGELTLGENIADNGGIHLAYEAYHLWKDATSEASPVLTYPVEEEKLQGKEGRHFDEGDWRHDMDSVHFDGDEREARREGEEAKRAGEKARREGEEAKREARREGEEAKHDFGGWHHDGKDPEKELHHHYHHGWAKDDVLYPFSGGDVKVRDMVTSLARALVQPTDVVADDRLFFTAFAQNWCEKRSPAYAELLRAIDPHSPGKWRVNGPLMNFDKFAEAFQCPVGSPMNPEKRCIIW